MTYTVVTSVTLGTYCSEVKADPDEDMNRSGQTAIVQIGATPGLCPDEAMTVTKTWTSATLVSTDTSSVPYTYEFDIGFEIKLDNIGEDDLEIKEIADLLPSGFVYTDMDFSGDVTTTPEPPNYESNTGRWEVVWEFDSGLSVSSGTSKSLKFTSKANISRGNYWSDVITEFDDGAFPDDKYTWPTAMVAVRDVFLNTASTVDDETLVANVQLNVAAEGGIVSTWDLP